MEPMETEPKRRLPSGCSVGRVTNLLMAFHFLLIMITALVVVGVLGGLNISVSYTLLGSCQIHGTAPIVNLVGVARRGSR